MTFPPGGRWRAVAQQRRIVIESRTVTGEPCTFIVERQPDGPLLVSLHGTRDATMAPSREELTMLRSWRPVFICGRAALAHQLGARVLGAHVVVDPALSPTEVLVTAERVGS